MTQDELKKMVAEAALEYVEPGTIIGIGTGSTANHFIDCLAGIKGKIDGTVASSCVVLTCSFAHDERLLLKDLTSCLKCGDGPE